MNIFQYLSEEYPQLLVMVDEMKRIQKDFSLLPEEYRNIDVTLIPCFIMTYNRPMDKQLSYLDLKGHCKPIFVCSTDDPYLEEFKKECPEEILVFDKADYVFSDEENGDNYGITPPFNKCVLFARRFIDDYTVKNNVGRYIVSDNDLILKIRFCDKVTKRFNKYPELVDFCILFYFYLLEKYDFLQYLTASNNGVEMMGKFYKVGYYFAPASFNFHLSTRPCRWISRFDEDTVTPLMILRKTGKLALNLPIIQLLQMTCVGEGDMSPVYKALSEELKNLKVDDLDNVTDENDRGKKLLTYFYLEQYFKGSVKRGYIRRAKTIKDIIEQRRAEQRYNKALENFSFYKSL